MPSLFSRLPGQARLIQSLLAIRDQLPPATPLLSLLDRHTPWVVKQGLVELSLNHVFADALKAGEFDELEGRSLRLELSDADVGVTLGLWRGRLRMAQGAGEATIRGTLEAFRLLALRQDDPDQLFFQRRLVIEGDVELGLGVKNLLDGIEWDLGVGFDRVSRVLG